MFYLSVLEAIWQRRMGRSPVLSVWVKQNPLVQHWSNSLLCPQIWILSLCMCNPPATWPVFCLHHALCTSKAGQTPWFPPYAQHPAIDRKPKQLGINQHATQAHHQPALRRSQTPYNPYRGKLRFRFYVLIRAL